MKKVILIIVSFITVMVVYANYVQSDYFDFANEKIKNYNPKRKDFVIIIDYRNNILSDRLFILDMKTNKVILSTKVSHAWNSGVLYPNSFSNISGTNKSSKGNYITRGTKYGMWGYSMIIDGLDEGTNNNAKSRAIIFHPDTKMKTKWSKGCFATSESVNRKIIDMTKGGVLVCVID